MRKRLLATTFTVTALSLAACATWMRGAPVTQHGDVAMLADGVYFRHGELEKLGFCNNGWVVFEDFVLAVDANFPDGAEICLAEIRKVTDKPVRFVFDTHHHGDHAYGNHIWAQAGALPVAQENVVTEMDRLEPKRWQAAEAKREDIRKLNSADGPMRPVVTFPRSMVLADSTRRVELLHFGTAHTRGDGFAYLPKEKILFTGDVVVNGPYNFMGDGDTKSWLQVLDALSKLDVDIIAPGHGACTDRSLIARQRAYIAFLRNAVADGVAAGKSLEDLQKTIQVPDDLRHYVGKMFPDQIEKIHSEMTG